MRLTAKTWEHIVGEHDELDVPREEVLATVNRPHVITPDPKAHRWRYWRRDVGPTRWLFVVVDWREPATIITAFGRRKDPI